MKKWMGRALALLMALALALPVAMAEEAVEEYGEIDLYDADIYREEELDLQSVAGYDDFGEGQAAMLSEDGPCDHGWLRINYDYDDSKPVYRSNGAYEHTAFDFVTQAELYCEDCYETLGYYTLNRYIQRTELHEFIYDKKLSKCSYCGQKAGAKCKHSKYHKLPRSEEFCSYLDASRHVRTREIIDQDDLVVCDTCGLCAYQYPSGKIDWDGKEFYQEEELEGTSVIEAHNYVNGVCTGCKQQKTVSFDVEQPKPEEGTVGSVVLTKNRTVTLNVGDTLAIDLDGKTAKSYKSASKKIAKVSKTGLVTAVKEGKTKITVTLSNKKKLTLTVKVTDPYKPSSVSLNYSGTVNLELGKTLTLSPTLSPTTARTTYTWSTSNKKIAKVSSSGVVTPVKAGTATITVKTANGKKASVKVKVNKVIQYELSVYFGRNLKTAAQEIGGMKATRQSYSQDESLGYGYYNDYFQLWSYPNKAIDHIILKKNSNYMLYGVKVGMSRQQVKSVLSGYSLEHDYSDLLVYAPKGYSYDSGYKWNVLPMYVEFTNTGYVKSVTLGGLS